MAGLNAPEVVAGYRLHGTNKSLQVRPERGDELARFEAIKFGADSLRARYLGAMAPVLSRLRQVPGAGGVLTRAAYLLNNSLSFATAHHWPGI